MGVIAPLTFRRYILYIYSTNIGTEYFKHVLYSPFSLQNAVCFIMLTCLVSVLFTFYIQDVLKLKNNSGAKGLRNATFRIRANRRVVSNPVGKNVQFISLQQYITFWNKKLFQHIQTNVSLNDISWTKEGLPHGRTELCTTDQLSRRHAHDDWYCH
jgi:hypothetical protein